MQKVEQAFLTSDKLSKIEKKDFSVQRLQYAKGLFVSRCYTGIAYIDVMQLTHPSIVNMISSQLLDKAYGITYHDGLVYAVGRDADSMVIWSPSQI